jgi:asparagine synthase (glutamine-hydrolysing)
MIKLYKNNSYKWFCKENIYAIGYVFYKDKLYEDNKLLELIISIKNNIKEEISYFDGAFSIVIDNKENIILISDIVRSFPLFYNKYGDVTDDIELLRTKLNKLSLKELVSCRWVSGDETIYEDVKQIECAQIITIENERIYKKKYFQYKHEKQQDFSFQELDRILNNCIKRCIRYLNGKTAVIPLSGGYDSRLIAYYLKKNNYDKIIAYTYGNRDGQEVKISKKVAEYLEIPWYFIEYTGKNCKKIYNNKERYADIADYFGRGYSIPHIQDLAAIDTLVNKNIIDKECVIIPGHLIDCIAGSHICEEFLKEKNLSKELLIQKIYINNYNLAKEDNHIFDNKLEKKFLESLNRKDFNDEDITTLYDRYDFEERQVKFIINSVRCYDYYGMKWYLPFADKQFIEFWQKVPLNLRYKKGYLIKFSSYKYKELMDKVPTYKKVKSKTNFIKKIYVRFFEYYNNQLGLYYYFKYRKYLYYVLIKFNFSYDYYIAEDYVKYLKNNKEIK